MIRIELPKALGPYADGENPVDIDEQCATVGDAIAALGIRSGRVLDRVMTETGEIRTHVNVFLNAENIRFMNGLDTPAPEGSTIIILAAISGG
ncbi:MAG: MoaD/ThiS family protein [Gemmatimonadales bacterium]